jgi:hypothetical protein
VVGCLFTVAALSAALTVQAPPLLRLGVDTEVPVSLSAPLEASWTLGATLGSLERTATDAMSLRYLPPATRQPALVFLFVRDATGLVIASSTLSLEGEGTLNVQTDPKARVVAEVDGVRFGPVNADGRGNAVLRIRAGPFVQTAHISAEDALGNVREKVVPLGAPAAAKHALICTQATATLLSLDDKEIALGVDRGELALENAFPGIRNFSYLAPVRASVGDVATIRAAAHRDVPSCAISLLGGRTEQLVVALARSEHVAGGAPVDVCVRFLDAEGRAGHPVHLARVETTLGTVGSLSNARGEWTLPSAFGGAASAQLRVRARSLEATAVIALRPAALATLEIEAPARLTADANSYAFVVRGRDASGNEVKLDAVNASARTGKTVIEETSKVRYSAPFVVHAGGDELRVTASDSRGTQEAVQRVELSPATPLFSLSARAGVQHNLGGVVSGATSLAFDVRLPFIARVLSLGVEVGLSAGQKKDALMRADVIAASGLLRVLAHPPIPAVDLYVGLLGGLAVGVAWLSGAQLQDARVETQTWAAGGVAGVARGVGRGAVHCELRFVYAGSSALASNVAGLSFGVGYQWFL